MTSARDIDLGAESAEWSASAAAGCRARVARELAPAALRFDYELAGAGAWAIARRELPFDLPEHYVAVLALRGSGPPCELQLKLVAPGGADVWWWRVPEHEPPAALRRLALRRASLTRAWGPSSEAEPRAVGAVEIAVASDRPVRGTLWIESARIEARPRERSALAPVGVRASSERPTFEAARALERASARGWRPAPGDESPWLELDLGERAEHGGVALRVSGASAASLRLLESDDGVAWTPLASACVVAGERAWLRSEGEARRVRVALDAAPEAELAELALVPLSLALAPARYAQTLARAAPRGRFPRHLLGEQAPWALVGAESAAQKGLLGGDGALELGAEGFSLEPFLVRNGRTFSWADAQAEPRLAADGLAIPGVRWEATDLRFDVTAFAHGTEDESALCALYRVENRGEVPCEGRLEVALRPFQVTPSWQSLGITPAFAPIREIAREGARIRVNGARDVLAVSAPDGFRTWPCDAPAPQAASDSSGRLEDPRGLAEGRLAFAFSLAPGASETLVLAAPLSARAPALPAGLPRSEAAAWGAARLRDASARWSERLARIPLSLPPAAAPLAESLRLSLAWMLLSRAGPRLLAGPRCYARSWMRDGAVTGVALAELGFGAELAEFLRWYAEHQLADGRIPCAVGPRGVDLAVEHDSHGQLVWALAEHWRLSGDAQLLRELWPRALRAADAIADLREPPGSPGAGLLPLSISHEGYSSRPVHSYWDDWFALRALGDAADAAQALGDAATHARMRGLRDAMRRDLAASLRAVIAERRLDFVPGSLELADFDPTATAIAFELGLDELLPEGALRTGFERFARELEARRRAGARWETCTPYEMRGAFAFLRLGQPERALALLEWFVAQQQPPAWRQWPEVVARDPRAPRFLGDLPHAWSAATFVRAVRRLVAYERADGALVIGAGVPDAWLRSGDGVCARGLPTHYGALDLELRAAAGGAVRARLAGPCRPPRGVRIALPGRAVRAVAALPAEIVLSGE